MDPSSDNFSSFHNFLEKVLCSVFYICDLNIFGFYARIFVSEWRFVHHIGGKPWHYRIKHRQSLSLFRFQISVGYGAIHTKAAAQNFFKIAPQTPMFHWLKIFCSVRRSSWTPFLLIFALRISYTRLSVSALKSFFRASLFWYFKNCCIFPVVSSLFDKFLKRSNVVRHFTTKFSAHLFNFRVSAAVASWELHVLDNIFPSCLSNDRKSMQTVFLEAVVPFHPSFRINLFLMQIVVPELRT